MIFDELNKHIPKGTPGDIHAHSLELGEGDGWHVQVSYPGKYGPNDFVVQVRSEGVWNKHRNFTHGDFFKDIGIKYVASPSAIRGDWLPHALKVIQGGVSPAPVGGHTFPGIHIEALTLATQALAVCEYRRYPQGDARGGGRYLPINYTSAMLYGHWTADRAWKMMRVGLPALRTLTGFKPFRHGDNVDEYIAAMAPAQ